MIRTYNFNAKCASGEWKEVTFTATDYREARKKLEEFIVSN